MCFFSASPRRCSQRSGAGGEEEGESEAAGGAEVSDQTTRGGEATQRDAAPPTGTQLRQVNTLGVHRKSHSSPPC